VDQDGNFGILAQLPKQLESVRIRQAEIEDDDVGLFVQSAPHGSPVFSVDTIDSGGGKCRAQHVPGRWIIFHN
jgi:hypothetical protein